MQFLAGGRPSSATTIVTPLEDRHGRPVALIVGVDAIDPEILAQPAGEDGFAATSLFPHDAAYLVVDADGTPVEASPGARERFARFRPMPPRWRSTANAGRSPATRRARRAIS